MSKARDLANAADVLDDVSATELGYVNGVTSAIQTQLNNKQALVSGVDDTEIGYLNGVTSAIQTQLDGKIAKSLVDAAGDLIYGSANDTVTRLGIGTAGQYLKVNSGATAPEWATLSAGGMTLIQETSASAVTSLSISSIPSTYKHLMLIWSTIYHSNADSSFGLRFNNDSGSNYAWQRLGATDTTLSVNYTSGTGVSQSGFEPFGFQTNAGTNELEKMAKGVLNIYNYADAGSTKFFIGSWNYWQSGGAQRNTPFIAGNFKGSAITSLDIFRSTGTGTFTTAVSNTIKLYGVS